MRLILVVALVRFLTLRLFLGGLRLLLELRFLLFFRTLLCLSRFFVSHLIIRVRAFSIAVVLSTSGMLLRTLAINVVVTSICVTRFLV